MARPLFIPRGNLREDIARLMGQDLEGRNPARPSLDTEAKRCFFRIKGISSSWNKDGDKDKEEKTKILRGAIEDLLTGLYAQGIPFAYLILGQEREIKIYWGIPISLGDDRFLPELLQGSLPGARLEAVKPISLLQELSALRYCAVMTGIPAPKEGEQLEGLLRGLYGERWAYLVASGPLEIGRIAATLETLAEEARRVKNTYLRKSSIEEDNHPLARYYLELLEAALARYKQGRVQGCWEARVLLFTAEPGILERGMALLASIYSGEKSLPMPIRLHRCSSTAKTKEARLPSTVLNTSDLSLLAQLPKEEMPGYRVFPHSRFALALPEAHRQAQSITLGQVLNHKRSTGNWLELAVTDLAKHASITGVTGSGKTETCHFLLDQLWREHRVPYLVIEPAKTEYRELRGAPGHEDLRIFTLGDEREAPFRMNPFAVPQGIHVQTHIDLLRTLFNATLAGLYPPMPYLLEEALYEVYLDRGWNLATGEGGDSFPTLSDLCTKVEEAVNRAGYDPEVTQNVRTALKVRLNSLRMGAKGRMLDTSRSIPMGELLQGPTILELAAIGDPEVVAFMMGLLLIRLYEYRTAETRGARELKLRHVTLIEEAHRFLSQQPQQAHPDLSQIRGQAIESFCNLLAEVRAFGEGLIITDQSPTKLHPDILKGTNLKVAHRLVAEDDRKAVGGSMNMDDSQVRALATLEVGEAAVYAEGFHRPFLVKVPSFREHALRRERLCRGVREQMRRFYEAHPELLALDYPYHAEQGPDGRFLEEFAEIIMEAEGDQLWERLAELSLGAVTVKDDEARAGLALRLALEAAARLRFPEAEQEKLARNLRRALQRLLRVEAD